MLAILIFNSHAPGTEREWCLDRRRQPAHTDQENVSHRALTPKRISGLGRKNISGFLC